MMCVIESDLHLLDDVSNVHLLKKKRLTDVNVSLKILILKKKNTLWR